MRMSARSPVAAGLAAFLAAVCLVTGCSVLFPTVQPSLPPPEPFGEFAVGEFGGVDGRQNILRVQPDGAAVLISREPAAGRLNGNDLARLRELLTSEQFRLEVAREAQDRQDPMRCSDQIITEVRMGDLALSRSGPCGAKERPPTPAFTEILSLVASARKGRFAAPLGDTAPPLVPVELRRLGGAGRLGYRIDVAADGGGSITIKDPPAHSGRLTVGQQDVLRLLLPILDAAAVTACSSTESYQIRIDDSAPRADCSWRRSQPEVRAVVTVLEAAFGV